MSLETILLSDIRECFTNTREFFNEEKLQRLAASIRDHGVETPVLVRENPDKATGTKYELVYGHRRFRASKLAEKEDIPAIIRWVPDEEIVEKQCLENDDREDVHPLERGQAYQRMKDSKRYGEGAAAVKAIAAKVNRSPRFVYDHLAFAKLTSEARKHFFDGAFSSSHATVIARLDKQWQSQLLKAFIRNGSCTHSVRDLEVWVSNNVTLSLKNTPFSIHDATLLPQVRGCDVCPKRTGAEAEELGEECADDRCLDRVCFAAKVKAHADRRLQNNLEKNPGALRVSGYNAHKGLQKYTDWEESNKSDKSAVLAVIDNSPRPEDLGKVVYVRLTSARAKAAVSGSGAAEAADAISEEERAKKAKRKEDLRLMRAENMARQRIYEQCLEKIRTGQPITLTGDLLRILVAKLAYHNGSFFGGDAKFRGASSDEAMKAVGIGHCYHPGPQNKDYAKVHPADSAELAIAALMAMTRDEVPLCDMHKPGSAAIDEFAKVLGVDATVIRAQADWEHLSKKQQAERLAAEKASTPSLPGVAEIRKGDVLFWVDPRGSRSGPYEVTKANKRGKYLDLNGRDWGSKGAGNAILNGLHPAGDGTWIGTHDSRYYFVRSHEAPEPSARRTSSYEVGKYIRVKDGEKLLVDGVEKTLLMTWIVPGDPGTPLEWPKRFLFFVESDEPNYAELLRVTPTMDGVWIEAKGRRVDLVPTYPTPKKEAHGQTEDPDAASAAAAPNAGAQDVTEAPGSPAQTEVTPEQIISDRGYDTYGKPVEQTATLGETPEDWKALIKPGTHLLDYATAEIRIVKEVRDVDAKPPALGVDLTRPDGLFMGAAMIRPHEELGFWAINKSRYKIVSATAKVDQALEATAKPIDADVLEVLGRCTVDANAVFLPEQLDRKLYERVNKVLEALGGKWNKKAKAHVFPHDAEEALSMAINTGRVTDRNKALQFYATPAAVAAQLCELADLTGDEILTVLEPSAGDGAIVRAIRDRARGTETPIGVVANEMDVAHLEALWTAVEDPEEDIFNDDFLVTSAEYFGAKDGFDRVIMNPPFSKQQDVDHVRHAFGMLKAGGILVAIMSPSWRFRENDKSRQFRAFVDELFGEVTELPENTFAESGTAVRTVILRLVKPAAAPLMQTAAKETVTA